MYLIIPLGDFVPGFFELKLKLFDFFVEIILQLECVVPFASFLGNLPGQSVHLSFEGKILATPSTLDVRQVQMSLLQSLFQ